MCSGFVGPFDLELGAKAARAAHHLIGLGGGVQGVPLGGMGSPGVGGGPSTLQMTTTPS